MSGAADVGADADLAIEIGIGQLLARQLQHLEVIGVTRQQYDTVRNALTEAGGWPADGCQLHVLFGDESDGRRSSRLTSSRRSRPDSGTVGLRRGSPRGALPLRARFSCTSLSRGE